VMIFIDNGFLVEFNFLLPSLVLKNSGEKRF
jgi:hypothetical protein